MNVRVIKKKEGKESQPVYISSLQSAATYLKNEEVESIDLVATLKNSEEYTAQEKARKKYIYDFESALKLGFIMFFIYGFLMSVRDYMLSTLPIHLYELSLLELGVVFAFYGCLTGFVGVVVGAFINIVMNIIFIIYWNRRVLKKKP